MGYFVKVVLEVVKLIEVNRWGIWLIGKLNYSMFFF